MAKFLITGGAGFIGANFCHFVVPKYKNDSFVCLDALTYAGKKENLNEILNLDNFKFIKGNICDRNLVNNLFEQEKFDYVINFAAESHVDNSISNPSKFIETNVMGVNVLLDACLKYGIKRFHQVSTDEVYGDLPLDSAYKFKETDVLKPSSPYSASKASADLLVLSYFRTFNLPVTISRCGNNYGPYQHEEKLIPKMVKNSLHNISLPIYGTGKNVRDWIYALDHCEAIDLIVRYGKNGEIYNVGANEEKTNLEIVNLILEYFNKDKDLIIFTKDRLGHDLRYSLDTSKIQKELGFVAKYPFDEYFIKTIKSYL